MNVCEQESAMLRRVAALYVDPRGPYPSMPDVECWDAERDARGYAGPHAIVAHPPCGPWGQFKHLCTKQPADLAPLAIEQVRRWGGVLEHPRFSTLWRHMKLPPPWGMPDEYGGRSYELQQVSWGHGCVKPTWLYVVGVPPDTILRDFREGGQPTHRMTNGPRGASANTELKRASAEKRRRTPPAFAEWLVALARSVQHDAPPHRPAAT